MTPQEASRAAFEAWMEDDKLKKLPDDLGYANPIVDACWLAWKTATAARDAEWQAFLLHVASINPHMELARYVEAMQGVQKQARELFYQLETK